MKFEARKIVLGLYLFVFITISFGSVAQKRNVGQQIKTDLKNGGLTILKTYARPLKWQKKEWLLFGGALGATFAASFFDDQINDFAIDNQNNTLSRISRAGDFLGQPENNYPVIIAAWGTGIIANSEKLRDTGIMIFASVTTSGILQTGLKALVGRARPGTGEGPKEFKPFGGAAYHSFPSGHTMLALATSWILAKQVKPLAAKILFYSVPVVVGFSRVYDGAHWFSDILLGSALGVACAEAVHKIYTNLKDEQKIDQKVFLVPSLNGLTLKIAI